MRRAIRLPPLKIAPDLNDVKSDGQQNLGASASNTRHDIVNIPSSSLSALVSPNGKKYSTHDDPETTSASSVVENNDSLVDCVLVYTEQADIESKVDAKQLSTVQRLIQRLPTDPSYSRPQKELIRKHFERHLESEYGLVIHHKKVTKEISKYSISKWWCRTKILQTTHYLTIHAPLHALLFSAENLRMKLPVEKMGGKTKDVSVQTKDIFEREYFDIWNRLKCWLKRLVDDRPWSEIYQPLYRTLVYSSSEIAQFKRFFDRRNRWNEDTSCSNDEDFLTVMEKNYFTLSERHWLTCELLSRVKDKVGIETKSAGQPSTSQTSSESYEYFGIHQLISHGIYDSCYPLHESLSETKQGDKFNDRRKLRKYWATLRYCWKFQPLNMIRSYMGEKVAFYFAAIGFYTMALIPPAIIGLIVFIYGVASMSSDKPTSDICGSFGQQTDMCPPCDKTCRFWKLSDSCTYAQISFIFDNIATVIFAILISIWARGFVEWWKRYQSKWQFRWDSIDFHECNEPIRPAFQREIVSTRWNPRTGRVEPYINKWTRLPKYLISTGVIFIMILIVCLTIFGSIVYRIQIAYILISVGLNSYSSIIITVTSAVINLICSLILSRYYYRIARKLTDWESHKYQSSYEAAFSIKAYIFEFVNFYSSLFYIAFFKGRTNGYPSTYGIRRTNDFNEQCDPAGCMVELSIQLLIVMFGKQTINALFEYGIPWITSRKICKRQSKKEEQWIIDHKLDEFDWQMLVPEYLEMTIQFGFVTLFVAAFPLAPLLALMNNLLELRGDAWKFLTRYRRPVLYKAGDIGVWTDILSAVSYLAVLTNGAVIAWTSNFIPELTYQVTDGAGKNLDGFVNWTLSSFPISDYNKTGTMNPNVPPNLTYCRYQEFRESTGPNYEHTILFWHTIAARLAFMIIFENVIYLIVYLFQLIVPDITSGVQEGIDKQRYGEQHHRAPPPKKPSKVKKIMEKVANEKKLTKSRQTTENTTNSNPEEGFCEQGTNTNPDITNTN